MRAKTALAIELVDMLLPFRRVLAQLAQTLPANFHQLRRTFGDYRGGARSATERGDFAEEFAWIDLRGAIFRQHSRYILEKDAHLVALGDSRFNRARFCAAGRLSLRIIAHLGVGRPAPKLRKGFKETFLLRFTTTEDFRRQGIERNAHAARENEEGGVTVITFTDDDVACGETANAGVVQQNTAERNARGKAGGIDRRERRDRQQAIDVGFRHLFPKRDVPALRTGDFREGRNHKRRAATSARARRKSSCTE